MRHRFRRMGRFVPALAMLLAITGSGCDNPFSPRIAPFRGVSTPPPVPNQDTEVIRLFWC